MRVWTVVFRPGPSWVPGRSVYEQELEGHGLYHQQLLEQGVLLLGGPFIDDAGGVALLLAADAEGARSLVEADPAIQSGVFEAEVHPQHVVFNRWVGKGLLDPGPGV